jgi:hypothetical protein
MRPETITLTIRGIYREVMYWRDGGEFCWDILNDDGTFDVLTDPEIEAIDLEVEQHYYESRGE